MIFILIFTLLICAMFGLYLISEKQITKTQKSRWAWCAKNTGMVRLVSMLLIITATVLCSDQYGSSIGFISLWIFLTPLIFGLILYINDLKPKQKVIRQPKAD